MVNQSDLAASNQLKISIVVIANSQAWMNQIQGVYALMYPYILRDFVFLKDWDMWRKQYDLHFHGNGNNGSPTVKPVIPIIWTGLLGYSFLSYNQAVGSLKSTFVQANATTMQIDIANKLLDATDQVGG